MEYTYKYPRPAVTTDAILIHRHNNEKFVLLIKRGINPYKGHWALPGGFINLDEELEVACSRELEEETGIKDIPITQFAAYGSVNRDPRGRTISVIFWAEVVQKLQAIAADDASDARWHNLDQLPPMAFDHQQIIQDFIREKLSNS